MDKDKLIAELTAENIKLKDENAALVGANTKLSGELSTLNVENEKLKILNKWYLEQFRLAQHRRFGTSSEKTVLPEQLGLFNEAETFANPKAAEPTLEQVAAHTRKKRKGKRDEFYNGLPTERIVHELPENERVCHICGGLLHACGHEVIRREIEIIPAAVKAVEHVQTVYGCRDCEQHSDADALPMVKAHVPAPVIRNSGVASPSLVSYILCNKYVLALPLYRQEQELKRLGINISRQTMSNWVIYVAERWLRPIYDLLKIELLLNDILHADETRVQVIVEKLRKASQKSYMWLYHTGKYAERHVALYEYQETREGCHALEFLKGYAGFLHVDGYAGYKKLEDQGVTIIECWAHMRRKFDETLKVLDKKDRPNHPANAGFEYCNKLFALEREYDDGKLSHDERREAREQKSRPVADEFFAWVTEMYDKTLPKSTFGEALTYARNQKHWLMNFLTDGRLELSNNRAEGSIRPFTVGRKNWLFSFAASGAEASALVYSIVETAQINGLMPYFYINYLLENLPNASPENFTDFLPWNPLVMEICKIPVPNSSAAV